MINSIPVPDIEEAILNVSSDMDVSMMSVATLDDSALDVNPNNTMVEMNSARLAEMEASYRGDPVKVQVRGDEASKTCVILIFIFSRQVLTKAEIEGPDGDILTSTAYFDEDDVLNLPTVDSAPYLGRAKGRPRFRPEDLEKWAQERAQLGVDGSKPGNNSGKSVAVSAPVSPDYHEAISKQLEEENKRLSRHFDKKDHKKIFDKKNICDVYDYPGT